MSSSPSPAPATRPALVLATVLALIKPLVRLLLRHGVAYPAFVAALKPVFLAAARDELAGRAMAQTDSALSLLSGVHRRDVRTLLRGQGGQGASVSVGPAHASPAPAAPTRTDADTPRPALGLAGEVVARWLGDPRYLGDDEQPRPLSRGGTDAGFDALVQAISSDVRPRAVLDELLRLGVVELEESGAQVRLRAAGFAPRQGFEEMAWLMRANLHDHLAGACANLDEDRNFLEQSIHVDEITEASALHLHRIAAQAWRQAFRTVMREAQARFDADAAHADPALRTERARFGAYFYTTRQDATHD